MIHPVFGSYANIFYPKQNIIFFAEKNDICRIPEISFVNSIKILVLDKKNFVYVFESYNYWTFF